MHLPVTTAAFRRYQSRAILLLSVVAAPALPAQGHAHPPATPAGSARPATVRMSGDSAGIIAAVRTLFSAAERNDLAALDTLYAAERLTIVEGAGINRGWADYRDHHLAPEMKEMKNFRYRPFEIEGNSSGDLGWALFRYALQADVNGKPVDLIGRGTAIFERRGNRWIVRHVQTSSRPRRAGDPAMPQ